MKDWDEPDQDTWLELLDWAEPDEPIFDEHYPENDAYTAEIGNREPLLVSAKRTCFDILGSLEKRLCKRGVSVTDLFNYIKLERGVTSKRNSTDHDWTFYVARLNAAAHDPKLFEILCAAATKHKANETDMVIRLAQEWMCDLWNCGIKFIDADTYNATYERAIRRFAEQRGISLTYALGNRIYEE